MKGLALDLRIAIASAELKIDRPVLRAEVDGPGVRLYLLGGDVVVWQPQKPPAAAPWRKPGKVKPPRRPVR
jgi:hypothetical protein